ncbi:hypothetical protein AVEN_123396-1 [Araneus ventricosus]|uniref:Uncharacterized protein n=1 Tax=Araneus ventricosus TaxID=182803 RepID=A0A4Y2LLR6_ARAVE|nr:hypothetical protein AVEN_123396-1 [Araneus ventricosus]
MEILFTFIATVASGILSKYGPELVKYWDSGENTMDSLNHHLKIKIRQQAVMMLEIKADPVNYVSLVNYALISAMLYDATLHARKKLASKCCTNARVQVVFTWFLLLSVGFMIYFLLKIYGLFMGPENSEAVIFGIILNHGLYWWLIHQILKHSRLRSPALPTIDED